MRKPGLLAFVLLLSLLGAVFYLYSSANRSLEQYSIDREAITKLSSQLVVWSNLMIEVGPRDPSEVFEPEARAALQLILASPSVQALAQMGLIPKPTLDSLSEDLTDPAKFTRTLRDFRALEDTYTKFLTQQSRTYAMLELAFYFAIAGLGAFLVFWLLDERGRRDRYEELQGVYRRSLVALEEERHRIALDLHDTVAQELVALKFQIARDDGGESSRSAIGETLDRAQTTLRQIAHGLRPPSIEQVGLVSALGELCHEFSRTTGIDVTRELENSGSLGLTSDREIHIYRIVQECLNNVWKHARCTHLLVAAWIEDGWFKVRVRDNGVGLEPVKVGSAGMGLAGMSERTALLGAKLSLDSSPGKGTEITLEVPL